MIFGCHDSPVDNWAGVNPPSHPASATFRQALRWSDYKFKCRVTAASVRRLVRDGVDTPLANLFVTAARPIPPEAEGAKRARSASEAFLYRRLETLRETRKRFQLNVDLPIVFDGWGRMEIDLLCADSRLVVEVEVPASRGSGRVPARSTQGPATAGKWLSRAALSRRGLGQGTGLSTRRDSARGEFAAEIASGDGYSHLVAREPCKVIC